MTHPIPARPQAERSDLSRARILDAAIRAFSENGLAGARTEQIAEAAGVNKALLYYYFQGKDALYTAALETVAERMAATGMSVLTLDCSPGERLLRSTLAHFDRIYSQPEFQSLLQQEMMRIRKGESESPLVEMLFKPLGEKTLAVVEEGIRAQELIPVEASQVTYAALGANVFYFLSAPMMRVMAGTDPFERSALEFRRKAAIEFLGLSLFVDREQGAQLAAKVLADTPMPEHIEPPTDPFTHVKMARNNIEAAQSSTAETRNK